MATLAELVAAQKAKAAGNAPAQLSTSSSEPKSEPEPEKANVNSETKQNNNAPGIKFSLGGTSKTEDNGSGEVKGIEQTEMGGTSKPEGIKISLFGKKTVEPNPDPSASANTTETVESDPQGAADFGLSGDLASVPTVVASSTELKEFNHSQMTDMMMPVDQETFRAAVSILHGVFDNPEIVMNATKNILRSLRDNPQFNTFLVPEDIGMMVRALRSSYGLVASSKTVAKDKRKSKQSSIDDVAAEIGALLK